MMIFLSFLALNNSSIPLFVFLFFNKVVIKKIYRLIYLFFCDFSRSLSVCVIVVVFVHT